MTGFVRSVIVFLLGAVLALSVLWLFEPPDNESIVWSQLTGEEVKDHIHDASRQDLADFINWAQSKEWEQDSDVIPAHVANAGKIQKARAAVFNRYPQFLGKDDEELFEVVRQTPLEYLQYCDELRAVDRFFIRN